MTVTTFSFPSTDRRHELEARRWTPDNVVDIVGTVQIVHGMAEHIDRYAEFAEFLAAHGWVVAGDNHLGHGHSVGQTPLGYFGKHQAIEHLIDDEFTLTKQLRHEYPGIPHIIIGHSMGAMMTQLYLTHYGAWVDAAVIIGSAAYHPALAIVRPVVAIFNFFAPRHPNHMLDNLAFGGYAKRFPESSPFQWLSANPQNVQRYNEDPLSGFTFTNNGFSILFRMATLSTHHHWFNGIPLTLPILFTSGQEDPVGGFSIGPRQHVKHLINAGHRNVSLKIWPGMRHEILNEDDRQLVYQAILTWLEQNAITERK
ncbi:alpha/beta fold hydrolase [Furfurilactobacillus curtus]|uniref:Alpha/beta hydrolase n=1 Tax=Furfurilactobacillus curtus TaxID=1746200 RepID=A0ABQ5JQN3_9LACO